MRGFGFFVLELFIRREDECHCLAKQFDYENKAVVAWALAVESGLFEKVVMKKRIDDELVPVVPEFQRVE